MNSRVNLIAVVIVFSLSSAWSQDLKILENAQDQALTDHAIHFAPAERKRRMVKPDKKSTTAPAKTFGDMGAMPGMDHRGMNHNSMPAIDQVSKPGTAQGLEHDMNHGSAVSGKTDAMSNRNHDINDAGHGSMSMQGGSSPPDARDPHAYSDGYDLGPLPQPQMGDEDNHGSLLVDRLESQTKRNNTSMTYDWQA